MRVRVRVVCFLGRWVCKLCGVCASCGTTTPGTAVSCRGVFHALLVMSHTDSTLLDLASGAATLGVDLTVEVAMVWLIIRVQNFTRARWA